MNLFLGFIAFICLMCAGEGAKEKYHPSVVPAFLLAMVLVIVAMVYFNIHKS